jgi:mRNA interferase RelE/StbE
VIRKDLATRRGRASNLWINFYLKKRLIPFGRGHGGLFLFTPGYAMLIVGMQVLLRPVAMKYLERLGKQDKGRIKAAFEDLSKEPPEGDIRPITGRKGYFRLRIGDFRALYRVEDDTIFVTNIDPRGQIYKKKNRGRK